MRRPALTSVMVALAVGAAHAAPVAAAPAPPAGTGADAYRYLLRYTAFGLHRTGTSGDRRVSNWLAGTFRDLGATTTTEKLSFQRYVVRQASLSTVGLSPRVFPLYYSGTTPAAGLQAELVDVRLGTPADFAASDVRGKIVVADVPLALNFFAPTLEDVLSRARAGGAAAVVAAVRGPLNEIVAQNVDARHGMCDLPTLVVGKDDGARLRALSGEAASFVLDATTKPAYATNTVGVIEGTGPDVLVVGTPTNGWFTTGAERGGGVGALLTLLRRTSEQARKDKPRQTIIFVATGGHEVGFLGLDDFVARHPELLPRITGYIHLGASIAAKEYDEVAGRVVQTGTPEENRALFVSENPLLEPIAHASFATAGAQPMLTVPPRVLDPGEQQYMYAVGVPMVSISGAHLWFHTRRDTPDTTSAELLDPVVRGYADVIDRLLQTPGDAVRGANGPAAALAPTPKVTACPGVPASG